MFKRSNSYTGYVRLTLVMVFLLLSGFAGFEVVASSDERVAVGQGSSVQVMQQIVEVMKMEIDQKSYDTYVTGQQMRILNIENSSTGFTEENPALVASTSVILQSGVVLYPGDSIYPGDVVLAGLLVNEGTDTIIVESEQDEKILELAPGESFGVLPGEETAPDIYVKTCTCKCGTTGGYVAVDRGIWKCSVMKANICVTLSGDLSKFTDCADRYIDIPVVAD